MSIEYVSLGTRIPSYEFASAEAWALRSAHSESLLSPPGSNTVVTEFRVAGDIIPMPKLAGVSLSAEFTLAPKCYQSLPHLASGRLTSRACRRAETDSSSTSKGPQLSSESWIHSAHPRVGQIGIGSTAYSRGIRFGFSPTLRASQIRLGTFGLRSSSHRRRNEVVPAFHGWWLT
ncbi:hypothetical protein PC116_g7531 [Phytophthora cactorum]|uniref:Uncharacterized protein n=1 Tax=Phytophthora cactorum TaxID=29920 RepID=A0A8T0ZPE6_9STRA|nr:hypothetical protein PC111_g3825 [Phytophthora cactorum]KAG2863914.1 hypothetical protein PC113_g5028 [Phytophthora cactorum]KAG2937251.1 hypothetical protein PC115_g4302 [Phytophthora cactorum]KAG2952406.1 hypothetical protein PC117_g2870 [Phytophthora cactorum]KAG2992592.1 hypothetical protein PC118_g4448 [Phytophthora cactorum]